MSRRLNDYNNVKEVFKNIANSSQLINITFKENQDNLATHLEIKKDNNTIDYYFIYGNTQVYRFFNDDNMKVISTNPKYLEQHIALNIEDFIKGKTID